MLKENFLTKTLTKAVLSRRSFLKWSAALGGTAALAGGINYGLKTVKAAAESAATEGTWIAAACWHNCGGRCPNYALVKDGVVIRQKTDDTHPDSPDFPQQRGCQRGRSQRHQVFGADRLKYPLKRKNWASGGGDQELRGQDEWVRISWDEALDIVAGEIKRIKEKYGNESILASAGSDMLNLYGGAVPVWWTNSGGTWRTTGRLVMGAPTGYPECNDRMDHRNVDLFVLWGCNPAWSSGGNPTYNFLQSKRLGARCIFIDPNYNDSISVLADEWIP